MEQSRIDVKMRANDEATEVTITLKSNDWIDPTQIALTLSRLVSEVLASAMGVVHISGMTDTPGPFENGEKLGEA